MPEPRIPTSTSPAAKRRLSIVLFVLAVVALAQAVVQLRDALGHAPRAIDDFIMPAFLLIFGAMLLAAARAARRPDTQLTIPPEERPLP
ncbi:MAG TPA: hypothetical protein VGC69_10425 [Bordetella sp.]